MSEKKRMNRREFITVTTGAASVATVLPRRVFGGPGHIAPSDRINVALVGCGTQALRQLMSDWLPREDINLVAICDPNTDSEDYRDWSPHGLRNAARQFLNRPNWGSKIGIRAGLIPAKELIEGAYMNERGQSDWKGLRLYTDYREMLAESQGVDAILDMTPEHLHGVINIAGMKAGKAVIAHKSLANTLHEVHQTVRVAKETGVTTHLMAWNNDPELYRLWEWLNQGVIGEVREVHNWSNRPIWPQGWIENPKEEMPVPDGLDWDLWLGCVPDRPYHIDYTHALFRGWYEFGSGCFGDMGHYSLWRTYRMLDPGPVISVQANAATGATIVGNQSQWRRSEVAFPTASTIHFEHQNVDIFWYDGGMKPRVPKGLLASGERLPPEGILYVGEYGTIVGNFLGTNFRLLPESRMAALEGSIPAKRAIEEVIHPIDEYMDAIREGRQSRGSFVNVADLAEASALATITLRTGEHIFWDAENMRVISNNVPHRLMTREYREGWTI